MNDSIRQDVTIADLLAHRAGLPYVDQELTTEDGCDWSRMTSLIAAQKPHWEPGSAHGYHSHTLGFAGGELVRRVDPSHRSYGQFVRDELDRDCYIGVPSDEVEARVSPVLRKLVGIIVLGDEHRLMSTFRIPGGHYCRATEAS